MTKPNYKIFESKIDGFLDGLKDIISKEISDFTFKLPEELVLYVKDSLSYYFNEIDYHIKQYSKAGSEKDKKAHELAIRSCYLNILNIKDMIKYKASGVIFSNVKSISIHVLTKILEYSLSIFLSVVLKEIFGDVSIKNIPR